MGSIPLLKGCLRQYYAQTYYAYNMLTLELRTSASKQQNRTCVISVSRIQRVRGLRARRIMSQARERIKAKVLFMHCSLCRQGMAICYQYLRFTRITSCFAAFAGRNGVTLLLNSAGFKHKSEFQQQVVKLFAISPQERSQKVRNPKFFWGACPQTPPSFCIIQKTWDTQQWC